MNVYQLLQVGDRVRMTDDFIRMDGGPRLSGIVTGYGSWHGMPGLVKVKHDETGREDSYCPAIWQRESDGARGKIPTADELAMMARAAKRLQTRYMGIKFRSRTEARWAVFFDAMGLRWEYEREGYALASGAYLPDFWLPAVSMWAEVKPTTFSPREKEKCFELATHTGFAVLMLDGAPKCKRYEAALPCEDPSGVVEEIQTYIITNEGGCIANEGRLFASMDDLAFADTHAAATAANSARFEYGESGALLDGQRN